jgi:hypothetical protein
MYQWPYWKMPEAFVWNTIKSISLSQFHEFTYLCMSQGLTFPNGVSSTDAS